MAVKYLLHFAHEHIPFRWTEFLALTSLHECNFKLISKEEHIRTRPFILIELEDESKTENLVRCAKSSYLLKGLFELWGESKISLEHLSDEAAKSAPFLSEIYSSPDQTFRVDCESYGTKTPQSTKIEWISKMDFMNTFKCRPDLKNPKQRYGIFEMNERKNRLEPLTKEYYFGRQIAQGDRSTIPSFSLKNRTFIANTSMDPMLSLISANVARVKPNDVVYDPFVGSGSLLVAAAYKGAYVMGADIDWKLLHGKSRPSRKGQKIRQPDESVRSNLRQYNLENRYLDIMVSDITRPAIVGRFKIDSIISDPPYGIRECSEKIGAKRMAKIVSKDKVRYPGKTVYTMNELLGDLLELSVKHLTIGGRLVFYLPVIRIGVSLDQFIPSHPCLNLVDYCEQQMAAKASRLMVVMEKTREPCPNDKVNVPDIITQMNFRDTYFGISTEKERETESEQLIK